MIFSFSLGQLMSFVAFKNQSVNLLYTYKIETN